MAIIFTLIITICGKALANLTVCLAKQIGNIKYRKLKRLEQFYLNNPTELRRLIYESSLKDQKLALQNSVIINWKQQVAKAGKKNSCFCERLRILLLCLTHNINPKDLETLFNYKYKTISNWLVNFKRFGALGIIPRGKLPWPLKNQTSPEIVNLIWRIHDENPVWGRWRIAQTLWRLLLFLSPSTIRNILKRPRPKKRPFWKPKKPLDLGPHLKKIIAKAKDKIWSIDLHEVMIGPYQSYIFGILDHFSRKILHLGFHFGEPDSEWVINQVRSTIAEYSCPNSIITDHGEQFTSREFKKFIYNFKIDHRKGKIRSPFSNGKIERFFGSLKRDVLNLTLVLTEKRINKLLKDYIIYYNQHRPHQSLLDATPEQCYHYNRIFSIKPLNQEKKILGKIKRIRFCDGMLNAYVLK